MVFKATGIPKSKEDATARQNLFDFYKKLANLLLEDSKKVAVFDRFFMSEVIYGRLRGYDDSEAYGGLEDVCVKSGSIMIIHLDPSKRWKEHSDLSGKTELQVRSLERDYATLSVKSKIKTYSIYTNKPRDKVNAEMLEILKKEGFA